MEGQARATYENLRRSLDSVGGTFEDVVVLNRFFTDLADQDIANKVHGEYFPGDVKPTTTTVQIVKLATDPRCLLEITAVAVID
jgi:2-iminobutanoate/2-iminopropanoate deaminase